jgi:hypothetical protein
VILLFLFFYKVFFFFVFCGNNEGEMEEGKTSEWLHFSGGPKSSLFYTGIYPQPKSVTSSCDDKENKPRRK